MFEIDRMKLDAMLGGYLEAIAFTDMSQPDDEAKDLELSEEALASCRADCEKFIPLATATIARHLGLGDLWADGAGYTNERLGHDFWLTRNGHGVGFWDRRFTYGEGGDEVEGLGDELSALCGFDTQFPQVDVYAGDDGKAHLA